MFNSSSAQGTLQIVASPIVGAPSSGPSEVKQDVFISNPGGADYIFVAGSQSQANFTWEVRFYYLGEILVWDDNLGDYVDTGAIWTPATYKQLVVKLDPGMSEIRYYYGGVLTYTGAIQGATNVEQLLWAHDNYQIITAPEPLIRPQDAAGGTPEFCDIDKVLWTDELTQNLSASWGRVKAAYR